MMSLGAVSLTMLVAVGFYYTMNSGSEGGEGTESASSSSSATPVVINVENARSERGKIYGYIFADSTTFDNFDHDNAAAVFELSP